MRAVLSQPDSRLAVHGARSLGRALLSTHIHAGRPSRASLLSDGFISRCSSAIAVAAFGWVALGATRIRRVAPAPRRANGCVRQPRPLRRHSALPDHAVAVQVVGVAAARHVRHRVAAGVAQAPQSAKPVAVDRPVLTAASASHQRAGDARSRRRPARVRVLGVLAAARGSSSSSLSTISRCWASVPTGATGAGRARWASSTSRWSARSTCRSD